MTPPHLRDLIHCLPVRLTAPLERGIRQHRVYLQRRLLRRVSLAEATRDLLRRALEFAPTRVAERRRRRAPPKQLGLSFTPKGEPRRLPSTPAGVEIRDARDATGGKV